MGVQTDFVKDQLGPKALKRIMKLIISRGIPGWFRIFPVTFEDFSNAI